MTQYQGIVGNFGIGFLASSISAGATSIQVSAVNSACSFPNLVSAAGQFLVTISAYDTNGYPTNPEVVLVTANSSGAMTVTRGQEGTSGVAHAANERVTLGITAGVFRNAAPGVGVQNGASPYTFDGSQPIMEIAAASPGASAVSVITGSLVPGRSYIIKDGAGNASSYNITITPDSGTFDGASTYVIDANYGAVTFYWNGTNLRVVA